jgi:hypothetical protein
MSDPEKEKRIDDLWAKARKLNNKIRFETRIAKMAEMNMKEMMVDDNLEGIDEFKLEM